MPAATLPSARSNYNRSARIARRASQKATEARSRGPAFVAGVVAAHQIAAARSGQLGITEMLVEQDISSGAEAILNMLSFTTEPETFGAMVEDIDTEERFASLVASIVQDAARAAESVAVAVQQDPLVAHVRMVNLPCCSRCAILAGRIYKWSDGFERHPGCDCSMVPTSDPEAFVQNPHELVEAGQVTGLSKDDIRALVDGADLNQVVNVRLKKAGLLEAGHALTRKGRPTPAGIYRLAKGDRAKALELLAQFRYIL